MSDPATVKAVLFDFTGVVANIRLALIGEDAESDYVAEPIADVAERISALRARNIVTVLVSNNDREALLAGASHIPFASMFDHMVFSSDVGVGKPDRRMFMAALDAAGTPAEECLFVDDVASNVEAAQTLGIRGLIADSPSTVTDAIDAIGAQHPSPEVD